MQSGRGATTTRNPTWFVASSVCLESVFFVSFNCVITFYVELVDQDRGPRASYFVGAELRY